MIKPIRAGGVTAGPWPRNSLEGEASPRICDTQRPFQWGASVVIVARRALWVVSVKIRKMIQFCVGKKRR